MPAKKLVLCLDGTWNNTYAEAKRADGRSIVKPSNVLKTARAINPTDTYNGINQIVYYDSGVGAMTQYPGMSNWILHKSDKILGGYTGAGFESNIENALTFLVHNYSPNTFSKDRDKIYIFGFSRGAATARALTQFIDWMEGIPAKEDAYYIPHMLRRYIETKGNRTVENIRQEIYKETTEKLNRSINEEEKVKKLKAFNKVEIEYLGIWDTVMALGAKFIPPEHREFYVSAVPAKCINTIFHALSIDERRSDFRPEIWKRRAHQNQALTQRWFAGSHSNIGGGYEKDGLANISLKWILDEASLHGLDFDNDFLKHYKAYPQHKLYNSSAIKYIIFDAIRFKYNKGRRSLLSYPPDSNLDLHYSVISRIKSHPKAHKNLELYRPNNVAKFLARKKDLEEYLDEISTRDRGKAMHEKRLPTDYLNLIDSFK